MHHPQRGAAETPPPDDEAAIVLLSKLRKRHGVIEAALEDGTASTLLRIFKRVRKELLARLEVLADAGRTDTFTAHHVAGLLEEVTAVIAAAQPELATALHNATAAAVRIGLGHAHAELVDLEATHGEAALAGRVAAATPTLPLAQIAYIAQPQNTVLAKFGADVEQATSDSLAASLTLGEGIKPAAKRLGETLDGEDWKLERIARTEINNAANVGHEATLASVIEDFPELDLKKQWSAATGDGRCCIHCQQIDGQVVPIASNFIAADGWSGSAPPKHPNCRCRVNGYSPRWAEGKQAKQPPTPVQGGTMHKTPTAAPVTLQAMSLGLPDAGGAPNRHPFEGILCRLDEPSTRPPEGSGGRRVILPTAVAQAILPTLLGQGVNYKATLNGHDVQQKVGVITEAWIDGRDVRVRGILYDQDFPNVVPAIRAATAAGEPIGMSFELGASLADAGAGLATIQQSNGFTGAAILKCKDAAYQDTQLAASAAEGDVPVTKEEFAALLAQGLSGVKTEIMTEVQAALKAAGKKKGKAGLKDDLSEAASLHGAMAGCLKGEGMDDARSAHGKLGEHLKAMKAAMADYFDGDGDEGGAVKGAAATPAATVTADPAVTAKLDEVAKALKAAGEKADAQDATIKSLEARLAGQATQTGDPGRTTISPAIAALLAKAEITVKEGEQPTAAQVHAALDKAGVTDPVARLEALSKVSNT